MNWRLNPVILAALVLLPSAATSRADLWPVLAAHYRLDETDTGSNIVYDEIGAVHGTRFGNVAIGAAGQVGTAYSFSNTEGAYVNLNRVDLLPNSNPFKLELWINKPSVSPGQSLQYILTNTLGGTAGRTNLYETGGTVILANAASGLSLQSLTTVNGEPFTVRDDQWHKITFTRQRYDDDNDLFQLYLDDILHASQTAANTIVFETTRNWQLGGTTYVAGGRPFTGLIDDVRVYVPEPSSAVLLLLAAGMLLIRRGRA